LGSIYFYLQDLDKALNIFRKVTAINPYYTNAYYGAGLIFLRQKKYSQARSVLEYAKELYLRENNQEQVKVTENLLQAIPE
jgi:tetratricopeptide (TPR) repeat protein